MRPLSLVFFTVLLFCVLGAPKLMAEQDKLVIAIQPTSTPEQLSAQSKELEAFLEERLGRDVELFFPLSYAGVIEALRFGHADAAFMGAWPAVLAGQKAGTEVILSEIREVMIDKEKKEESYYFSYWVVARDSAYQSLQDLRGKKAAFPSQVSSSGYVAPLAKLVELGFIKRENAAADPKSFFSEVFFAGGYAQAWEALKKGQVDVTVIAGDVPESLYNEVLENTRTVEQQGPIPSHVIVVRKDTSDEMKKSLVDAFMALNDPQWRPLMRKFVSGIFVRFQPADSAHLASLNGMIEKTGFEFTEKK